MFLDEAVVEFISGRGGSGAVSFHREKHVPRGGPNGADGGRGGDIVLVADRNQRTLYDFKLHPRHVAGDGSHGVGNKRGKDGKGLIIKLPVGTVVYDDELGEPIVDLNRHGMKFLLCRGGKGGFGNQHYTNSVRQAPNFAQKGAPGERVLARLQLKLLADVALIGCPNAGKSTLISRISAAKPKIADYPFTTIVPNLGVVRFGDTSFTVADLPGLIEGASEGVGLGHQFLRHVERCRVLVHVVDAFPIDGSDPVENYRMIEEELLRYSEEIHARPRVIALNKVDLVPAGEHGKLRQRFEDLGRPVYAISAVSGEGLDPLLWELVEQLRQSPAEEVETVTPVLSRPQGAWKVVKEDDGFRVVGPRIEKLVAMTDLENDEAVRYLHRRLTRLGIIDKLREEGADEGDLVMIGDFEFAFTDEE
jgi:GTP-binding protein